MVASTLTFPNRVTFAIDSDLVKTTRNIQLLSNQPLSRVFNSRTPVTSSGGAVVHQEASVTHKAQRWVRGRQPAKNC